MPTVLQGYTSLLAESPVLLHHSLMTSVFSSGTLICHVWLVTEHGQMMVSAQKKSPDKEELLFGESQKEIICFLLNHFLCLLFLFFFPPNFFLLQNSASPQKYSTLCKAVLCSVSFLGRVFLFSLLLCWSQCPAVLCAVSEAASNGKDPAVCVNFVKVLAGWHFHTCNRSKLCCRVSFSYYFCKSLHFV